MTLSLLHAIDSEILFLKSYLSDASVISIFAPIFRILKPDLKISNRLLTRESYLDGCVKSQS